MDEQSRAAGPPSAHGDGDTEAGAAKEQADGVPAAEQTGKLRPAYLDSSGSEATRELRDTARRRRDAEEKLQQHLMEAKHHVPNEFHEHGHPVPGDTGHEPSEHRGAGARRQESGRAEDGRPENDGPDNDGSEEERRADGRPEGERDEGERAGA